MKVLLTGGGTGGHITPLLAVAHELKQLQPDCETVFVGERNGKFEHMVEGQSDLDNVRTIFAGKFRRYHGESWLKRLLDVKTNVLNLRDALYVLVGIMQSLWLIKREKPDVVLLKGGFVGMPIGLAAAFWRVPFITHDSDALPGLANRLVSRWASIHATGMPLSYYSYPEESARYVGVLVSADYKPVDEKLQNQYKQELGLSGAGQVLFITGGSHGSRRINHAVAKITPSLLEHFPDLHILHQVGKGNESALNSFTHPRLTVTPFVKGMHRYSGAADVIVTRAGANTLAEFGVQGKACVVIPHPQLSGGHQLKNAESLASEGAAVIIDESALQGDSLTLKEALVSLFSDASRRQQLGHKLQSMTPADATQKLSVLLLELSKR